METRLVLLSSVLLIIPGCMSFATLQVDNEIKYSYSKGIHLGYFSLAHAIDNKEMNIYFQSSGGFAGINSRIELDTSSMSSNDAMRIQELINNSNFFSLPSESPPPKAGAADYISYKITVETDERKHTVRTNDIAMPPQLEPLISFLQEKASLMASEY